MKCQGVLVRHLEGLVLRAFVRCLSTALSHGEMSKASHTRKHTHTHTHTLKASMCLVSGTGGLTPTCNAVWKHLHVCVCLCVIVCVCVCVSRPRSALSQPYQRQIVCLCVCVFVCVMNLF